MGFVGLGGQGGGHLFGGAWTYLPGGYLGRADVQVLGVCDVQRKRAEDAATRVGRHYADRADRASYPGCRAYDDIRELVTDPQIDAVLIAAAYHAAATNSLVALHAGKDVYCEKPTSVTIRAGRAVADAVAAYGRVYQAGTQQRSEYDGRFRRAVELVRGGHIGRLQRVYAYQGGGGLDPPPSAEPNGNVPDDVNWEAYVNCLPWFNYDGNTGAHRFGTGEINWGQHHLDIAQWGADGDRTGPEEIRLEDGKPVFRYASGVEIYGCPPPGQGWDAGGATFVGTDGSITVHREVLVSDPPELLRETPVPNDAGVYYSSSHSGNFLECVRTRQATICNAESTHRASSLLLLGGIAMRLGRTLRWDPVAERFIDAPDADRLLDMAAREPWQYGC
jgi:predicted dehydrogenase